MQETHVPGRNSGSQDLLKTRFDINDPGEMSCRITARDHQGCRKRPGDPVCDGLKIFLILGVCVAIFLFLVVG